MMHMLGLAAAFGVLILLWLVVPLLMAPLVLLGAVLQHSLPRCRVQTPVTTADVHELATLHPSDGVHLAA